MKPLIFALCVAFGFGGLSAQTPGWQPSPGHTQLPIWPGAVQQRVAIARALVNNPSLLLADEPTGNLDSRTSIEIMDILQNLNDQHGLTVVIVTHEPDIAQFAKRALEFRDGKMKKDVLIQRRSIAAEILPTLPSLQEEDDLDAIAGGGPETKPNGNSTPK